MNARQTRVGDGIVSVCKASYVMRFLVAIDVEKRVI
jgi:hypothetical protein